MWRPNTPPAIVVVHQGTNDAAFTASQYQTYLAAIRSAYPAARIFAIVPCLKTTHADPIRAAVTALADSRVFFLDYSDAFRAADTSDNVHFNPGGAISMGIKLASDIRAHLASRWA